MLLRKAQTGRGLSGNSAVCMFLCHMSEEDQSVGRVAGGLIYIFNPKAFNNIICLKWHFCCLLLGNLACPPVTWPSEFWREIFSFRPVRVIYSINWCPLSFLIICLINIQTFLWSHLHSWLKPTASHSPKTCSLGGEVSVVVCLPVSALPGAAHLSRCTCLSPVAAVPVPHDSGSEKC